MQFANPDQTVLKKRKTEHQVDDSEPVFEQSPFSFSEIESKKKSITNDYEKLWHEAKKKTLQIDGKDMQLTPLTKGGAFFNTFRIGDKRVLKLLNNKWIKRKPEVLDGHLIYYLDKHESAVQAGLSVVPIYNKDTAREQKVIIQEEMPYQIDVANPCHVDQLHCMFLTILKKGLILKLSPKDIAVQGERVALFDFPKEPYGDIWYSNPSEGMLMTCIISSLYDWCSYGQKQQGWDRKQTSLFLSNLTESFEYFGYPLAYNTTILDRLCGKPINWGYPDSRWHPSQSTRITGRPSKAMQKLQFDSPKKPQITIAHEDEPVDDEASDLIFD